MIAQEEIFGPVLSIIAYDTESEAVEIANDTVYGLAAGVWSGDQQRASPWPASCGPARSRSTGARSTPWPLSAVTSSRATAASSGTLAWRSSWRSSPSSCDGSDRVKSREQFVVLRVGGVRRVGDSLEHEELPADDDDPYMDDVAR